MSEYLHPDAARAIAFLRWLNPDAPIHLEHMSSDGPERPAATVFLPQEREAAECFVADNNADRQRRNMYWLPNAEFLSGKRAKANLSAARFLHVDLDCKDYPGTENEQSDRIVGLLTDARQRPKGVPVPSVIWFTGGGYQAVWRLAEPIGIDPAEEMNRALLAALQGGPGTHDPSRLLRLPRTVNWLNDKKRAAGRTPALAIVLEPLDFDNPPVSYKSDDFKLRRPKESTCPEVAQGVSVDLAALEPLPLPDDLREILPSDPHWVGAIVTGLNPPDKSYQSRSELVFAASLWMLSQDVKPGHIVSVLINPDYGISAPGRRVQVNAECGLTVWT